MPTPTLRALRSELAQLTKDFAAIDPDALTKPEHAMLRAKMKALKTLIAKIEARIAQSP
jgi:hypothetical protein